MLKRPRDPQALAQHDSDSENHKSGFDHATESDTVQSRRSPYRLIRHNTIRLDSIHEAAIQYLIPCYDSGLTHEATIQWKRWVDIGWCCRISYDMIQLWFWADTLIWISYIRIQSWFIKPWYDMILAYAPNQLKYDSVAIYNTAILLCYGTIQCWFTRRQVDVKRRPESDPIQFRFNSQWFIIRWCLESNTIWFSFDSRAKDSILDDSLNLTLYNLD